MTLMGHFFFAASEKAFSVIEHATIETRAIVLDFSDVSTIDITAIHAFELALDRLSDLPVYLLGLLPHVERKLDHAGVLELTNLHIAHSISQLQQTLVVNSDIASYQESTL